MENQRKLAIIEDLLTDEDVGLHRLSDLEGAELLEIQAIADLITQSIAVVILARQYMFNQGDKNE